MGRVTAVFDSRAQAEAAVNELRTIGVTDTHLSFVSRHDLEEKGESALEGAGKGLAVGATAGALFGIAAALIPGVGPFITAGALAQSLGAVAGGAVAGAVVGGTTGGLAGAIASAGYDPKEAEYYGAAVERGGVMVVADVPESLEPQVREVLNRHKGSFYNPVGYR